VYDVMRQAPSDPACAEPFQELLAAIKNPIG
jgi:flagellum-specific ATP synthase